MFFSNNDIVTPFWNRKWALQPVRNCCKGSIFGQVAPAF